MNLHDESRDDAAFMDDKKPVTMEKRDAMSSKEDSSVEVSKDNRDDRILGRH